MLAREDRVGDKRFVGEVTGVADPADIRARLGQRLPTYLVLGCGSGVAGAAADVQRQARTCPPDQKPKFGLDNDIPQISAQVMAKYVTELQLLGLL